jgi:hypothetical protein
MPPIHSFHVFLGFGILLTLFQQVSAVTVYYQPGQAPISATATAAGANYTGLAAYDTSTLNPPPVPNPFNTQFTIQLQNGGTPNVSIPQVGSFIGFSIEMSVVNQVGALLPPSLQYFRCTYVVLSRKKFLSTSSPVPQFDG